MTIVSSQSEYKFGAGRYWQEPDAIRLIGAEAKRLGCKAYILGGENALSLTVKQLTGSLTQAGIPYEVERYSGFASREKVASLQLCVMAEGCDVLVGVGGGRILDIAKAVGAAMDLPVIMVPTSAATCAAYAPLSVLYREDGAFDCGIRHEKEVDAVLVDTVIQSVQPPHLLVSGMLDAMAKSIEMANGRAALQLEDTPLPLHSAVAFAQYTYQILEQYGCQAVRDLREGRYTKLVDDLVFVNIALTGMVSGLTKNKGQAAMAHALYNAARTHFPQESQAFLHGEIVAVGLLAQLIYNDCGERAPILRDFMRRLKVPCSLAEINITPTQENLDLLYEDIRRQRFVVQDNTHFVGLKEALRYIGGGKV